MNLLRVLDTNGKPIPGLFRDTKTGSLLVKNDRELNKYKSERQIRETQEMRLSKVEGDLDEIKKMLQVLIGRVEK